jgi:hypothetical protein
MPRKDLQKADSTAAIEIAIVVWKLKFTETSSLQAIQYMDFCSWGIHYDTEIRNGTFIKNIEGLCFLPSHNNKNPIQHKREKELRVKKSRLCLNSTTHSICDFEQIH